MSAATEALIGQAQIEGAFVVFPVSAWIIRCEVCNVEETVAARPGEQSRNRVVRAGRAWLTAHRMDCPGPPYKRSDRK